MPKTISDQRRVLRGIADLLSQQTLSSEDIDELTDLLGVVLNQRDRRTLQRELAVLWKSSAKGAVHRARVKSIEDLWLREHPASRSVGGGRVVASLEAVGSCADFERSAREANVVTQPCPSVR